MPLLCRDKGAGLKTIPDPFQFAAENRSINGEAAAGGFPRLADLLSGSGGPVSYRIDGMLDAERRPALQLAVRGKLDLRCQRCLGELAWDCVVDTTLQLVRAGQAIPDEELENDEADAFEVEGEVGVMALIEDEILLAMPLAPRHERCELPARDGGPGEKSPFAVLASLRGGNGGT